MKILFLVILLGLSFNSYSHNNGSEHVHNRNVIGSDYYHPNYHDREWCPTGYGHYHGYDYYGNAHYITIIIGDPYHRTYRNHPRTRDTHRSRIHKHRVKSHHYRSHQSNVCVSVDNLNVCLSR